MPSSDLSPADHVRIACARLAFADGLRTAASTDPEAVGWAVTAIYYAALHAVSGYVLACHGERAATHRDRDEWFRSGRFPELRADTLVYVGLKSRSEWFRYDGKVYAWTEFDRLRTSVGPLVTKYTTRAAKP